MTAGSGLRTLLPGRHDYAALRTSWRADLPAGVTVGVVALPLALAFGVSSGAGAQAGLVTAIVAGLVAAVLGGSHVQVSGPTGAMVVVLAPIVATHGAAAVPVVALLAGALVVAAGVLRLGRLVGMIPWPVIEGFTLGIALIIFLQQVPAAVGVPAAGHDANAAVAAFQSLGETTPRDAVWSAGVVAVVVAVMLLAPRLHRAVPGSLVAIILVTVVTGVAHLPVATIGALPAGLPAPAWPTVDLTTLAGLGGPAVTVAALAAIESLLSARVAASHTSTGPYDADRELVGQGLASVASGLFGGMPATGAIARTAVNVSSGGRTRVAAVVHALVLLVVVGSLSGVVAHVPLPALAGVLMVTAVRMVSVRGVRLVVRSTRAAAVLFTLTAVVTVSVDLVYAVGAGIVVAAALSLRAMARAAGVHREELPGPPVAGDERIALFRVEGALFFAAAERVLERVAAIDGVGVVVLRLSQVQLLDATGAQVLGELVAGLHRRGVTVLIKGLQPDHLGLARRVGVLDPLGDDQVFAHLHDAVAHARRVVALDTRPVSAAGTPAA
ncbi:SulP family inorganic anion transporter [Cellulomonas sp. H30R-01]|uniref:SulP family inorganic anion transporter n=1 Tax=Cellulomonas sp. H30R-01 TaxID=2704467 RepID=UPI00138D2631|nr:SulP family inorganic anion transporter [Cellulomonas sp. H30R-01]QHT55885.1 SulP family inorganic anion transporter [Cellulomonas sp. H30R-01]